MGPESQVLDALALLVEKYALLHRLRDRRDAVAREGQDRFDFDEARARKAAFKRLASAFPGSLRELERLPASALRLRLDAVQQAHRLALAGKAVALPPWMDVALGFHAALRQALRVKRWLALHAPPPCPLTEALRAQLCLALELDPRDLTLEHLALHRTPPGGRLQTLVWTDLERRFGLPRAELDALIFGGPNPGS